MQDTTLLAPLTLSVPYLAVMWMNELCMRLKTAVLKFKAVSVRRRIVKHRVTWVIFMKLGGSIY
jgi:hypothetical protein